jgi:hypothetical protein
MVALAGKRVGDLSALPKDPTVVLAALDRFVQKNAMASDADRVDFAVVIDHASHLVPAGDRDSLQAATHLVTFLNWASSPYVKRQNAAFVLLASRLADISDRLSENPHVARLEVPLPAEAERKAFLETTLAGTDAGTFSDFSVQQIATLTAGIALTDVETLVRSGQEGGRRLDAARFRDLKKRLIERQAQDLLEFVEPRWNLDLVVGHEGAKRRLLDDAALIQKGVLDCAPMGYLLCGPVSTGSRSWHSAPPARSAYPAWSCAISAPSTSARPRATSSGSWASSAPWGR